MARRKIDRSTHKLCKICGKLLDTSNFYLTSRNNPAANCKLCSHEVQKTKRAERKRVQPPGLSVTLDNYSYEFVMDMFHVKFINTQ